MKVNELEMQLKILDKMFEADDYEKESVTLSFVQKKNPINLHASTLMLKCFIKLLQML